MMSNKLIITKTTLDEEDRVLKIDYFVTNGTTLTDGASAIPAYGICVHLSVDGKCLDSSTIDDVSPSEETAVRMAQLFAKNLVTPVSLRDVVEDCLALQL